MKSWFDRVHALSQILAAWVLLNLMDDAAMLALLFC